jgi:GTP cyclohydrolase I
MSDPAVCLIQTRGLEQPATRPGAREPKPRQFLHDVQSQPDDREIAIEQVGVSELRYPITVLDRAAESQRTVATIALSVGVPHDAKGTHMSRFIQVLETHRGEITGRTLPSVLADLKATLDAESARIEFELVPAERKLMPYECTFTGRTRADLRALGDHPGIPADCRALVLALRLSHR